MDGSPVTAGSADETIDLDRAEVRISLRCVECGYDVRGLKAGRNCPECGHAVLATVHAAMETQSAGAPNLPHSRRIGSALFLSVLLMSLGVLFNHASAIYYTLVGSSSIGVVYLGQWPPLICWVVAVPLFWFIVPHRASALHARLCLAAGLVSVALAMMVISHHHFRWSIYSIGIVDLGFGEEMMFEYAVLWFLGLAGGVLGISLALGGLALASLQPRAARHTRQGTWTMLASIGAGLIGFLLIYVPTLEIVGEVVLRVAQFMILIGFIYLALNAWWIRQALARPPMRIGQILAANADRHH